MKKIKEEAMKVYRYISSITKKDTRPALKKDLNFVDIELLIKSLGEYLKETSIKE